MLLNSMLTSVHHDNFNAEKLVGVTVPLLILAPPGSESSLYPAKQHKQTIQLVGRATPVHSEKITYT